MDMKRFLSLFFLAAALFSAPAAAASALADTMPAVSARASVLFEPEGGRFPFEKNADERLPIASTTKLMTALVALRLTPTDTLLTVPAAACGIEGSSVYLRQGEKLTAEQLLYALLLRSANDAASALAIALSGSEEAFVAEMNAEAARLGCTDTHFANPHGLDNPEHYSSARDLARIMAACAENADFLRICGEKKYVLPLDGRTQVLTNHNKLLFLRDDVLCGKTGFTKKAGRCLVSLSDRDGVRLIAVTINAPDDWNDHLRLFDYGATLFVRRTIVTEGQRFRISLSGGTERYAYCRAAGAISAVVPRSGQSDITTDLLLPSILFAPVHTGDALGVCEVWAGKTLIGETALLCERDVPEKTTEKRGIRKLFSFLR